MRAGLVLFLLTAYKGLLQAGNGRYLLISSELKVAPFNAFLWYSTFNPENFFLTLGKYCIDSRWEAFSFSVTAQACLGFHKQGGKKNHFCFFPVGIDKMGYNKIIKISVLFSLFKYVPYRAY